MWLRHGESWPLWSAAVDRQLGGLRVLRKGRVAGLASLLTAGAAQKSEDVWDGLGKDTASVIPIFFFYYPLGRILLSKWAWLD